MRWHQRREFSPLPGEVSSGQWVVQKEGGGEGLLLGGLLKLAAFLQNISVAGCTGKMRRGWMREFITRLCFLLWVWWAAALPLFVSLSRLMFCILVRAEVDAWWMVDHISACSLSQSSPRLKIPAASVCQAGPSCPALTWCHPASPSALPAVYFPRM